jgi:hypothetical protein
MVLQRALVVFVLSDLVLLASCGAGVGQDAGDVGPDAPELAFSVHPERVVFGAACVGEGAGPAVITVSNDGTAPLVGLWVTMRGDSHAFSIDVGACERLEAGRSCTIAVFVAPDAEEGSARATLEVSLGEETRAVPLEVDRVWCDQGPDVTPTPYRFGETVVGERGPLQRFTVRWIPVSNSRLSAAIRGVDEDSFVVVADDCSGLTSPATGPCNVDVAFAPSHAGNCFGALVVEATPGHASFVSLLGNGLARTTDVEIAPHTSNLGVVGVGCEGPIETLTLTSIGTIATGPLRVALGGDDAGSFAIVNDRCAAGLAVGEHCEVDVRFVPLRAGSALATLDVEVTGGTRRAALTGLATTDPCRP